MKTINEINEELGFNLELMDLLDVIKNISIFRFRALQAKKRRFPRFSEELKGFLGMLDLKASGHPFVKPAVERAAIAVVTSDEGFMGGLNLQVIESALRAPEAHRAELIVVGEKGARHMSDIGRRGFAAFKSAGSFEERYRLAVQIKDHILKGAKEKRFGKALVFYPRPVTFIMQKVEALQLLPLVSVIPAKAGIHNEIIIESPLGGIIDYLAEEDLVSKLVDVLEDSKLSEFASRALHLEESTRRLGDTQKALRFQYFRAYHERIDRNIRELFSAQIIGKKD